MAHNETQLCRSIVRTSTNDTTDGTPSKTSNVPTNPDSVPSDTMSPPSTTSSPHDEEGEQAPGRSAVFRVFNTLELVEKIFFHATAASVIRGKAVCKFVKSAIDHSPTIRSKMDNLSLFSNHPLNPLNVNIAGCSILMGENSNKNKYFQLFLNIDRRPWNISRFTKQSKLLALKLWSDDTEIGMSRFDCHCMICNGFQAKPIRALPWHPIKGVTLGDLIDRAYCCKCKERCTSDANDSIACSGFFSIIYR